jgi:hypothetical protein
MTPVTSLVAVPLYMRQCRLVYRLALIPGGAGCHPDHHRAALRWPVLKTVPVTSPEALDLIAWHVDEKI